MAAQPLKDARVRKTQRRLREALLSLIHEKSYDAIVVNEILKRAEVGRSAFYAHFANKDGLLASGIDHMLHATAPRTAPLTVLRFRKMLWFSLPVFEYVGQCGHAAEAKMSRSDRAVVHQHLRQALIKQIADDSKATVQDMQTVGTKIPQELLAEYIVATFILVLNWWAGTRSRLSPQEVDDVFLSLVVPTLDAIAGDS